MKSMMSVASYGTLPEYSKSFSSHGQAYNTTTPLLGHPHPSRSRAYTDDLNNHSKKRPSRNANYIDVLAKIGGRTEEDEETVPPSQGRVSNRQAFFTMIKAIVGSGLLFLPKAFADGGVVFSAFAECFIAVLTAACIMLVITARGSSSLSFSELGELAGGAAGRLAVQGTLLTFQLGLVISYFIFVADTTVSLVRDLTGCSWDPNPTVLIILHATLQIPLACLRNIRRLALLAEVADFCIVGGILLVLYVCAAKVWTDGPAEVPAIRPYTIPLFVGTSVVSFEGVAIMVPIKESMQTPEAFTSVLLVATVVVCVLYTVVGVLGVLAFGVEVDQNILLSVGGHGFVARAVSVLYGAAIICSLPLQAYPAYRVLEIALGIPSGKHIAKAKWTKNVLRALIIITLAVLAVVTRTYLHYIVAVIGGIAGVPMGFIIPAFIHYRVCGTQPVTDVCIMIFGAVMMCLVTGLAVKEWVTSGPTAPIPCVVV